MNEFRFAVHAVLNNWSALQLALEHGMGGPRGREMAIELTDEIVKHFYGTINLECHHIAELLTITLDIRFNTICEDNSPEEVAAVIWNFYQYLHLNNIDKFRTELGKLLNVKNNWYSSIQMPETLSAPPSLVGNSSSVCNAEAGPSKGSSAVQAGIGQFSDTCSYNGSDNSFLDSSGTLVIPEESSTCGSSLSHTSEREPSSASSMSNGDETWILVGGRKIKGKT